MKKLLITLCLFFTEIGISAQTTIDNDFFTIKVPAGWQGIDVPMYTDSLGWTQCAMLSKSTANSPCSMAILCTTEKVLDLDYLLGVNQVSSQMQAVTKDAEVEVGDIYSATFLNKDAKARNFTVKKDGETADIILYAFHVSNYSAQAMELNLSGVKTDFKELWNSIIWKEYVKKEAAADPLDEELKTTISIINQMLQSSEIQESMKEEFTIDTSSKSIALKIQNSDLLASKLSKDQLTGIRKSQEQMGSDLLKQLTAQMEVLNKAIKKGYTFKIIVVDKNGKLIAECPIKPVE